MNESFDERITVTPVDATYLLLHGGQVRGPLTLWSLRTYVAAIPVTDDVLVWSEHANDWCPIDEVEALNTPFATTRSAKSVAETVSTANRPRVHPPSAAYPIPRSEVRTSVPISGVNFFRVALGTRARARRVFHSVLRTRTVNRLVISAAVVALAGVAFETYRFLEARSTWKALLRDASPDASTAEARMIHFESSTGDLAGSTTPWIPLTVRGGVGFVAVFPLDVGAHLTLETRPERRTLVPLSNETIADVRNIPVRRGLSGLVRALPEGREYPSGYYAFTFTGPHGWRSSTRRVYLGSVAPAEYESAIAKRNARLERDLVKLRSQLGEIVASTVSQYRALRAPLEARVPWKERRSKIPHYLKDWGNFQRVLDAEIANLSLRFPEARLLAEPVIRDLKNESESLLAFAADMNLDGVDAKGANERVSGWLKSIGEHDERVARIAGDLDRLAKDSFAFL